MSLLIGFGAFSIFLAIAALGFFFLMASFLLGGLFGHDDLGGHDADFHGDVHGDVHGVSFFNTRVLSVFITAFGGFGAIGIHLGYRVETSSALGLVGGLVFGGLIYLFASFLYGQQATSNIRLSELIGRTAQVSVAIPKGGLGQVRCTLGESVVEKIAKAEDSGEIPANAQVSIVAVIGETVLVRRAE